MGELWQMSAAEIAAAVGRREIRATEVVEAVLQRIAAVDGAMRAFVTVTGEAALEAANELDRDPARGIGLPLAGVPFSVKDLTETKGVLTTYGSRLHERFVPDYDAECIRRLKAAGGILIGKTNTPEFGNRGTTEYGLFGPTHNPWDLSRSAGGSSGGAATAVAAGIGPIAEGTDGGGSIRIPSSWCGVIGLKPSRGRISDAPTGVARGGFVAHGPIARTVADIALMLDVMSGPMPGDQYWVSPPPSGGFLATLRPSGSDRPLGARLRIAVLNRSHELIDPQIASTVERIAKVLEELGHFVEEAGPDLSDLDPSFRIVCAASSAAQGIDPAAYTDPLSGLLARRGREIRAAEYIQALDFVQMRSRQIITFFDDFDVLVTPTLTKNPPLLGDFGASPATALREDAELIPFTFPFNMTGQPALTLPAGRTPEGMPIGVQLVGRPADEATLLRLARELEDAGQLASSWPALGGTPDSPRSDRRSTSPSDIAGRS
jgi:amidase